MKISCRPVIRLYLITLGIMAGRPSRYDFKKVWEVIADKQARDLIAAALASAVDEECSEHWHGLTQEPALTARIGKTLETRLNGAEVAGWRIKVVTQDFPDRGPGALERKLGADLYVGIEVTDGSKTSSKGFLAQAKWANETSDQTTLARQCNDMLARTGAAYVWFYGENGVTFLPAELVRTRTDRTLFRGRPLAPELAKVLECTRGDPNLGLPAGRPLRQALSGMLLDMGASTGVGVSMTRVERS